MNIIDIKRIKHLEACKKWRDNNREKYRKISLASANKKKESNPKEYQKVMNDRAKEYRLKNLDEHKKKERENSRRLRERDKDAYNKQQREYRKNNPEKFSQYIKRYKDKNKVRARIKLLKKYNLTQELYDSMLLKQEGKCAICKMLFEETKPNIDHSHEDGDVRGLLCSPCNIVLGYVEKIQKKIPDFDFRKFTEYLK